MKVIIASTNPIKIQAAQKGFDSLFTETDVIVEGVTGSSGVSDQPMTDSETYNGAYNRAMRIQKAHPDADYWVGIEGGIEKNNENGFDAFAWTVILSNTQKGQSRTASFTLPPKICALINQGYELGDADDMVFKQKNTKQKSGAVGLLTNNVIDRAELYAPSVILALIPFKNQNLYPLKTMLDKKIHNA